MATTDIPNVQDETIKAAMAECSLSAIKLEEAQGIHRATLKRWQGSGVDTKQLMRVRKDRAQDPDVLALEEKTRIRYRALFGIMPTTQTEIVYRDEDPEVVAQAAGELGYASGKRGDDVNTACPYPAGTLPFVAWHERFDQGRRAAAQLAAVTPGVRTVTAQRRPRGRKPVEMVNLAGEQPVKRGRGRPRKVPTNGETYGPA